MSSGSDRTQQSGCFGLWFCYMLVHAARFAWTSIHHENKHSVFVLRNSLFEMLAPLGTLECFFLAATRCLQLFCEDLYTHDVTAPNSSKTQRRP